MIGAGINVFAVWNYIIVKARSGRVEINPKLLAFTLGGTEEEVLNALTFLCSPDHNSRSKLEEGRRIIKEGEFQYRLVNWEFYQKIRNEDDRREYNRQKQAEYRSRKKNPIEVGLVTTTDKLSEMVGEFGANGRSNKPQEIKTRTAAKIAREEKIQEEVRAKFNPDYAPGGPKAIEPLRKRKV